MAYWLAQVHFPKVDFFIACCSTGSLLMWPKSIVKSSHVLHYIDIMQYLGLLPTVLLNN